jgi:hypothetical protein
MTAGPTGRGEPPRRVAPGYRLWVARRGSPRQPGGGSRHVWQQGGENQRAQVAAFWAMILGRFRDYLHMTSALNDDRYSTLGGPDDTGQ